MTKGEKKKKKTQKGVGEQKSHLIVLLPLAG